MKINKKILAVIISIMTIILLVGCTKTQEIKKDEAIKIVDSYNREISLEKPPERVVSLSPGATETIYALNSQNSLVGRSDYCDYPEEATKIESVGQITEPNIEKIAELNPDLVIASAHFSKELVDKIEALGIKVAVLYGEDSFDGAYKNIQDIALVLGKQEEGTKIVDGMKKKVEEVGNKVKDLKKPSVYYVVGFGKTDFTAGGNTFIGQIIDRAGGDNIAKEVDGWNYSKEVLMEKNPDIVVLSDKYDSKSGFTTGEGYKDLRAVKEGNVYELDDNMLSRQGPRQADGLEALAKIIHPEAFK
ncbi:ABC transporter substrate-binding protein [Clostridium intestinale]|uniref:Iron chelate uptake ABC transporter solute-binding protein n=1 Tax=Clostridium intestinale URNW TaxID=1294142 RepID=U2NL32_9CLOT|nr:ABC transporter substrate-binding protein [Clostridium intestinale]ERK29551.1 iron chelate uptake ABC transporter solute-binding protein [Clostridium intestinale URNW]